MQVLISNLYVNGKKVNDIVVDGVDIEMSDELITKICLQEIEKKYKTWKFNDNWDWRFL